MVYLRAFELVRDLLRGVLRSSWCSSSVSRRARPSSAAKAGLHGPLANEGAPQLNGNAGDDRAQGLQLLDSHRISRKLLTLSRDAPELEYRWKDLRTSMILRLSEKERSTRRDFSSFVFSSTELITRY